MRYYAQIKDNICIAVSSLAGPVASPDMIELSTRDTSLLGKVWDGEKFIENPNPPVQPPTIEERLTAAEAAILALMG